MVKFMTILMAAFKEFHLYRVSFHFIPLSIYMISQYSPQSLTNIEMFLRRCDSRVILIRRAVPHFRARTISSLARTSGRRAVGFTTGRPGRSFVLLRELHLLPLHLPRASITSRATVFINACRHVPELISYSDEVIRSAGLLFGD